jgi:CubicO group peptidase (beta-lactamase class C family)
MRFRRFEIGISIMAGVMLGVANRARAESNDAIDLAVTAFMSKNGIPGLSIAIVKDGHLSFAAGYGLASVENFVPAKATTVYRSGSMGKPMTAVAAMQLVERGKLDLDADVRKYCPAFPAKRWSVTPRELLAHTSGIRHYGGAHDEEEQRSTIHYRSVVDALAPFKNDPLLFKPGTKHVYSTYGYDVLGCVIEGSSGESFLGYMREHVWAPAGMRDTRDDDPSAVIPNRADGFVRTNGELRRAVLADLSNRMPAGGYATTVVDLARFLESVLDHRSIGAESFKRMITPTRLSTGEIVPYGLGWGVELEPWHEDAYVFHGGSTPGASGLLVPMPAHRFALAFLTNLENTPERSEFAEAITKLVLGFQANARSAPEKAPTLDLPPGLARVLIDYEAAWRAKDAHALAALFTEDGFVLQEGVPPVKGRLEIERAYHGAGGALSLRAISFATSGGIGHIIGAYAREQGGPDVGKFTLTLRQDAAGRWLIVSDMDNRNR